MIIMHKYFGTGDLIDKIKNVTMLKDDKRYPYLNSYITIETIDPKYLFPCQFYILKKQLDFMLSLKEEFNKKNIDILDLCGYIIFRLEFESEIRTILPPIIEESIENNGKIYPLINDGMHRIFLALLQKRKINVIYIRGSNEPYYAYPLQNGWNDVNIVNELTKNIIKKIHRIGDNKKLYRNFDSAFMNCSKPRGISSI